MNGQHIRRAVVPTWILVAILTLGLVAWSRDHFHSELRGSEARRIELAQVQMVGAEYPRTWNNDNQATEIDLPDNWDGRIPTYEGYVWYHLRWPTFPARLDRPSVYLPAAGMNAELWVNGKRVGGSGYMQQPLTRNFYTPQLIEIPIELMHQDRIENSLSILVAGHPGYRSGLAPIWVGEYERLYQAWKVRRFWQIEGNAASIVLNLTIAVFVLLVGWRDKSHVAYRWFAVAVLVWAIRNLNYWVVNPAFSNLLFAELCVSGEAWFVSLFAIFAIRFSELNAASYAGPAWLPRVAIGYSCIATAYFVSASSYLTANAGFLVLAAVGTGLIVWGTLRLMRLVVLAPSPQLLVVSCGALIYLILLINDYAIGINRTTLGEVYLRQYAALPLFIAITATLAKRYSDAHRQATELAQSLHLKVEEQRALLESSFQQLREAEREQARTQERARLMGDLHDGLGLHLATALRQARNPQAPKDLLLESLQDCLDELRLAVDSLDEQERDPLSLLSSLRFRMRPRFESMGVRLNWRIAPTLPDLRALDPNQALDLLRIVQELLGNALKHSEANVVTLSLDISHNHIHIGIKDNGVGYSPLTVKHGRGLGGLQIRAKRLGGALVWEDAHPGSLVTLVLPLV